MKKVIIFIVVILITTVGIYVAYNDIKKDEDTSTKSLDEDNYFEQLIQYKVESINDEENLDELLKKLELGEYLIDIKKEFDGEKEYIALYYDCTDEEHVLEYFRNFQNQSILQKNSVSLFALINKLEKVTYNFDISDTILADKYHLGVLPTTNKFLERSSSFTRDQIEKNYNQDVRNYVENPEQFMKYDIDLNVSDITIYMVEGSEIKTIEINDKADVDNIVQYIKTQNFGIPDSWLNSFCQDWIDLNNGYIIEFYGTDEYGGIIKGDGKEVFANGQVNYKKMDHCGYKTLPKGLTEYIEKIIEAEGAQ